MAKGMANGILLLSGGIDSAVAGHLAKNAGSEIVALHLSSTKITGSETVEKSKKLSEMIGAKKLVVKDISNELAEIASKCEHRYYFVLMKRFMLRLAQKLASQEKASFIVTGESLGQVSSQTLSNMSVIDQSVSIPVLRPLLGFDKQEIIDMARKIGTLETSTGREMCDALGPPKPATKSDEWKILEEEKRLGKEFLENSKALENFQLKTS